MLLNNGVDFDEKYLV